MTHKIVLKNLAINVSLVFGSLLLCAVVVESFLRFAYPIYESAARTKYERDTMRIWAPRPNRVSKVRHPDTGIPHFVIQNNLNLRQSRNLENLSSTINLAFFGDSLTANLGLPSPYSFTEPLDYLLNRTGRRFNVLNLGVNGYGTDQEYLHYKDFEQRNRLNKVFYVLSANDLRNIYENNLFTLNAQGELVRNPIPEPPWWIKPVSRLHITYLALDLRQRLLYSRTGDLEVYRAAMQQIAMTEAHTARFHNERADALQRSLVRGEDNEHLDRTMLIFQHLLEQWKNAVESNGAEFYVVLVPREREEVFKAFLSDKFRVISLLELFRGSNVGYEWSAIRFRNDGHWAEEGNRLTALHLYKALEDDLKLPPTATEELERSLALYYSAFPNGWMPQQAVMTTTASQDELSRIRGKYIALELDK